MAKSFPLILGVLIILGVAALYLYLSAPIPTGSLEDANVSDRCAQFRQYDDEDKDIYTLGYAGRIRQIFHGCF